MTTLAHPATLEAALTACDQLLILLPEDRLTDGWAARALPQALAEAFQPIADGLKAGPHGKHREAWLQRPVRRLVVGALPQRLSRHNTPTRRDAIFELTRKVGLEGRATVLAVLDETEHQLAALAGIASAHPIYDRHAETSWPDELRLACVSGDGTFLPSPAPVQFALNEVRATAALVDTPAEEMTTTAMTAAATRVVEEIDGVQARILEGDELLDHGLTALHAVGRAATHPPRLVVLDTGPRGNGDTVALVGKGIVYDTGGLHLKGRGAMDLMKCDMGGAAAVLGAFRLLARENLDSRVYCILALAENAIGPTAYRPGDIVRTHAGRTIEINNTDAEGRLVLADGLSYAARVLDAKVLIDAATLTGAQMISTGHRHAAVVSNDEALERLSVTAGSITGEMCHPMLFAPEFYQREFASKVADMKNSVKDRSNAQSSCAAQFLWRQIDDCDVRWLHVDLAGPAFREERGTGFGTLLLGRIVVGLGEVTGG